MKHTSPVAIVLIHEKDKFLLTQRHEPGHFSHELWQFPGGGVEFGEHPEQTAIREAKEEIGVDIEVISLFPKIYSSLDTNWHGIFITYFCKIKDPKAVITLNEESINYKWLTKEEVKKLHDENKCFRGIYSMIEIASRLILK